MKGRRQRRVRAALSGLTACCLAASLWALLPGDVSDAGSLERAGVGFLALGAPLLLAAIWIDIRLIHDELRSWCGTGLRPGSTGDD